LPTNVSNYPSLRTLPAKPYAKFSKKRT
jgi:hypothetical protein